ncbi:hypothetical protein ABBQ38_004897 [Trebouxia sp. C0009 RCD-2024]
MNLTLNSACPSNVGSMVTIDNVCSDCATEQIMTLGIARFGNEPELAAFLGKLDPDYAQYAPMLWQKGIRTPQQLSNAREQILLSAGLPELHIDDIQARADGAGELLAFSNLFEHHAFISLSSKQQRVVVASSSQASGFGLFSKTEALRQPLPHSRCLIVWLYVWV